MYYTESSLVDSWVELSSEGWFGDFWKVVKGFADIAGAISDLAGLAK